MLLLLPRRRPLQLPFNIVPSCRRCKRALLVCALVVLSHHAVYPTVRPVWYQLVCPARRRGGNSNRCPASKTPAGSPIWLQGRCRGPLCTCWCSAYWLAALHAYGSLLYVLCRCDMNCPLWTKQSGLGVTPLAMLLMCHTQLAQLKISAQQFSVSQRVL